MADRFRTTSTSGWFVGQILDEPFRAKAKKDEERGEER